ncbi:MAG: DUF1844 domain-containing protein [Deltaproteobacteria bacterium]|nr:MAG: DUF1844 domain-containing protein [Deltaproteobacteria bacterium]
MADDEKDLGFKVEDRRRFDASGEARDTGGDEEEDKDASREQTAESSARSAGEETQGQGQQQDDGAAQRAQAGGGPAGELTFSSFVVGLASQAFMFLGLAPDPQTGVVHQDLGQAKAMIDILSMLEAKTAGNLDEDEAHMMEEMLYELRLQYVKAVKGGGRPPQEETR